MDQTNTEEAKPKRPAKSGIMKILWPLVLALLAAVIAYQFLPNSTPPPVRLSTWLVAKTPIANGSVITANQVGLQTGPANLQTPENLTQASQAVGQVALANLLPGETIRRGDVQAPSSTGLEYVIPAGQRAMTIAVNQISGVDGRLMLNELVDVLSSPGSAGSNAAPTPPTLVLSGVRILALGPPTPQTADTNLGTGQPALYSTVTLSVTVAQAETLALAEESGQVTLLAIGITGK